MSTEQHEVTPRFRLHVTHVIAAAALGALLAYGWKVIGPSLSSLTNPHWDWLPIALLAEVISMGASARMQRHALAQGGVTLSREHAAS